MVNKKIFQLISQYLDMGTFYGTVDEKYILKDEEELEVIFPKSYKEFLRQYGCGDILGITISGIQESEYSSVVANTERYRKLLIIGRKYR